MNTAIGLKRFTDMGDGLAGGIAGPWRSTQTQHTELTAASVIAATTPHADSWEPTFGATIWYC